MSEWAAKLEAYVFPRNILTPDMKFGIEYEPVSLRIYAEKNRNIFVMRSGLIVNKNYPWLGVSPDGFALMEDGSIEFLEVKCTKAGKTYHGEELALNLPFLTITNGVITMRKKHRFYGQIQMGLALCNLKNAKLLVYTHCKKDNLVVPVSFDGDFVTQMTGNLFNVYFKHLLPFLTEKSDKLKIKKIMISG